jgi:membrane associated rhomboid family serine protease
MIGDALVFLSFLLFILIQLFLMSFLLPLPINDSGTVRYRTIPYMTILLIVINSLVFVGWQAVELYQGSAALDSGAMNQGMTLLQGYLDKVWLYGYRVSYLRESLSIGGFVTFTSMFMHADMWHLLGNMIFLWTFGRRVEDACGSGRFLLYYLLAGMIANIGSVVLNPSMIDRPSIGASGAIAGVMGAYLLMFPGAKIQSLWGLGSIVRTPIVAVGRTLGIGNLQNAPTWRWTVVLPAWLYLFYFLIRETVPSLETVQQGRDLGGVNNLAHVTGFLAALAIFLFARKDLVLRFISGRSV